MLDVCVNLAALARLGINDFQSTLNAVALLHIDLVQLFRLVGKGPGVNRWRDRRDGVNYFGGKNVKSVNLRLTGKTLCCARLVTRPSHDQIGIPAHGDLLLQSQVDPRGSGAGFVRRQVRPPEVFGE